MVVLLPLGVIFLAAGAPQVGAKFGSLIAGAVILSVAWVTLAPRRPRVGHILLAAAGVVLAILGFAVFDALRPAGSSSHLGLLVRQIVAEGPSALVNVAVRKLAMNLRLMRYTIWADVLVAFIVAVGLLLYRPVGLMRRLVEAHPHLAQGFWMTTLTAAVAFATNDAGVVAAATLMLYPTALLLQLALAETSSRSTSSTRR